MLSTNGPVYEINGQIHMGHPGQVVLPALPENLVSKPTLVWRLHNARTALQRVEASYLTGGITWRADYVVIVDAADARSDLMGWVTIDNKSGATYANAALKLVAGDVNRAKDRGEIRAMLGRAAQAPAAEAAGRFGEETFFEYHLYSLDPITVDVVERMPGDWKVLRATHPHEKVQAFTAKWSLPVPKDGETKLTYRVRVRW